MTEPSTPHLEHSRPPLRTLDPNAISAWRLTTGAAALFLLAMWMGFLFGLYQTGLLTQLPLLIGLGAAGVLVAALATWFGPLVEWRHWRYDVREDEIDLQSGIITITRTLIPITRVQHVDLRHGPVERRFGLATIVVHTAAGSRGIPGISVTEADPIRSRIAALANIHDDL